MDNLNATHEERLDKAVQLYRDVTDKHIAYLESVIRYQQDRIDTLLKGIDKQEATLSNLRGAIDTLLGRTR